jgi:hypothetical protein
MSPRRGTPIPVSVDNGVDPGVVLGRLRRSWGILVRRDASPARGTRPHLSGEDRP